MAGFLPQVKTGYLMSIKCVLMRGARCLYIPNGYNILCSDNEDVTSRLDATIRKEDFQVVVSGYHPIQCEGKNLAQSREVARKKLTMKNTKNSKKLLIKSGENVFVNTLTYNG
jgi:hypothetical protein